MQREGVGGINNDFVFSLGFGGTVVLITDMGYPGKEQIVGNQEFCLGYVNFSAILFLLIHF